MSFVFFRTQKKGIKEVTNVLRVFSEQKTVFENKNHMFDFYF